MDKVSIIIPVYNAGEFLHQSLDSVVAQTYQNLEIICINDASEDNSLDILKQYAAKDPRFIIINEGKFGSSECRNIGLERATGNFCICLDADDFFAPEMISKAYHKIKKSGADICIFPYLEYDHQKQQCLGDKKGFSPKVKVEEDIISPKDYSDSIFTYINGATWNKLYNKKFIDQHNFRFLNVPACNDVTFTFLTIANAQKIALLDEPLLYYRVNLKTSITSKRKKTVGAAMTAVERLREELKKSGQWEIYKKSFLHQAFILLRVDYKFCAPELKKSCKKKILEYCSGEDWVGFDDIDFQIFSLDKEKLGLFKYWISFLGLKLKKKLKKI